MHSRSFGARTADGAHRLSRSMEYTPEGYDPWLDQELQSNQVGTPRAGR